MEILPSNRRETAVAVTYTPDDPRCMAIASRYGTEQNLYTIVSTGTPSADTPSMVLCMKTYGPDAVTRQLASRMKMAALRMGETTMDNIDAGLIAQGIADDPGARILAYDLVMGFFTRLEQGHFNLYSCKPRHVMEAWQQYSKGAHQEQTRLREEAEKKRHDEEMAEHRKNAITFEEFKRRTGYQEENPINQKV